MLMKARNAKDIHMGIITFLYTDRGTQGLIDKVKSGDQKVLQVRAALNKYLDGNKYNLLDVVSASETHEEVTPELVRERAQNVLEAIKDVKSGRHDTSGPKKDTEELLAHVREGNIEALEKYLDSSINPDTLRWRKKQLVDDKDSFLEAAKENKDEESRNAMIKWLEKLDWEFKEGTKEYKLTGKPSPQKIVEYYTLVFSNKSNLTSANRSKMIPKVGAANIFGSKKNVLYPALQHIIEESNFTLDDELINIFRKQKTKLSISKKKAITNLIGNTPMPKGHGIKNLEGLSEDASGLEQKEVLNLIESDEKYGEAFNSYVKYLQLGLSNYTRSIPKEDYDILESELENKDDVAREYGFDNYQDWDNWMDGKEGRNAALDAMVEKDNRMVVSIKRPADVKLLSRMFSDKDVDVKGSISEAASTKVKSSLNDNKFHSNHVLVEDIIEMLSNLAEVFEATDFDDLVGELLEETDETKVIELVEECVDTLEKGDYQRIRVAFLNATIQRMEEIASKSILLAEDEDENIKGQVEPLNILRELGLLQAVKA